MKGYLIIATLLAFAGTCVFQFFYFKRIGFTWLISCIYYKGDNFCDFLFAFLHANSLLKKGPLKGKNLLPRGANSFLLEQILFIREPKPFWNTYLPWTVSISLEYFFLNLILVQIYFIISD